MHGVVLKFYRTTCKKNYSKHSLCDFVNDEVVPTAAEAPSGGWRYVPNDRAIAFTGEAVPSFNDAVDIYYFPAFDRFQNVGRDLPF